MRLKKTYIIVFVLIGILCSAFVSFADNRAFWIEGEVTHRPYKIENTHYMIEVNKVTYKILDDIRITHRYLRNKGAYDESSASIDSISTGRTIMIKARKKEIIQIILF
ncbi:MAG: hypothetical protein GY857_04570 [Desulfobacula sp.]|nr:hypothetical protein [Desulfobacula sp.]